jgi:hypothetical protein
MNERPKTSPELDKALNILLHQGSTVDLRLLGSRPAEPDALDWRVPLDMTINSIGYALDDLHSAIERGGRDADYLRLTDNQAILQSRLTKFMLICSVLQGRKHLQAAE